MRRNQLEKQLRATERRAEAQRNALDQLVGRVARVEEQLKDIKKGVMDELIAKLNKAEGDGPLGRLKAWAADTFAKLYTERELAQVQKDVKTLTHQVCSRETLRPPGELTHSACPALLLSWTAS